ncbi:MAG: TonB-dependent receptor [Edaphobacter sp.]
MVIQLRSIFVSILLFALGSLAFAQSAGVQGQVSDTSGAVIAKASVRIVNQETGVELHVNTNGNGQYSASALEPGIYKIFVQESGFTSAVSDPITLNVAQTAVLDFKLKVGSASEEVVVDASATNINTSDATVSTVIDREFVQEIPLNGRSFQNLILLAPGVLTATPQGGDTGSFSVNGMRTDANYHVVDGVSANNGAALASGAGSAGMASNATAIGTTQSILPLDALQEFRMSTSTYTAESGRQAGAQISFLSRSGTNQYHGALFDYIRNTAFDANNWFNTYSNPPIARPPERQNDFGGFVSGPLTIPKLYSGKDRAFFFFAYEGLRLTQPQPATVYWVPSNGTYSSAAYKNVQLANVRKYTPAALQPVVNAYPLPNCTVQRDALCVDYGDGLSPYLATGSAISPVDSVSARIDFQAFRGTRVFARFSDTTSNSTAPLTTGPDTAVNVVRTRTYLLGADTVFRANISNELRLQYSPASIVQSYTPSSAGGAQPVNLQTLQGLPAVGGETFVEFEEPSNGLTNKIYSLNYGTLQFQPNAVDTVSWTYRNHFFKAGVDYRQTTSYLNDGKWSRSPGSYNYYKSPNQILSNQPSTIETFNLLRQDPTTKNLGLFFDDAWRILPRLSLSLGLRWDLNPPPSISGAQQYSYTGSPIVAGSMALSKLGAPLYKTTYTDFQPRLGIAAVLHNQPGNETVLRAGAGLYYDAVSVFDAVGSDESLGPGVNQFFGTSYGDTQGFPVSADVILAPNTTPTPPYPLAYFAAPNLHPPSALHWNVSLEQAFGQRQSVVLGYVGSKGEDLIDLKEYNVTQTNPLFTSFFQAENGPGSSYNALQVQYKRRAFHGLQLQAAYTWAHALDSNSADSTWLPIQRGDSNHDVRNNFTSALVYNLPTQYADRWQRAILGSWSLSLWLLARSAFPVQVNGATVVVDGTEYATRLNYNGGNPYLYKAGVPGGRLFNPAVFSVPTAEQGIDGNAPRNFLRGFGAAEADIALQRRFPLHDQMSLSFRAEAFNIINHPNFGAVNSGCGATAAGAVCNSPVMGEATNTLSVALGGLSPIYQHGGPRSLQFALRLQF